ncbi:hypothetical protein M8J77_016326 [Diaphorina citri]|nr:hypothetical protein M8J77_016326 [Diaphorina citri]
MQNTRSTSIQEWKSLVRKFPPWQRFEPSTSGLRVSALHHSATEVGTRRYCVQENIAIWQKPSVRFVKMFKCVTKQNNSSVHEMRNNRSFSPEVKWQHWSGEFKVNSYILGVNSGKSQDA